MLLDPVPQPKVTCEQIGTNVTLLCSVDPPVQAEFKWSGPNWFSHVGNSVHITRKPNKEFIYFCIAKNKVSEKVVEFNLMDCPEDHPVAIPSHLVALYTTVFYNIVLICALAFLYCNYYNVNNDEDVITTVEFRFVSDGFQTSKSLYY